MAKALRKKMVDELAEKFQGQKNLVLVSTQGLTANQTVELRAQLRESKVKMRVVKNSVALHTFKKLGIDAFEKHLGGMNAVVFGPDPLAIAKKLTAYREKNQKADVKAAVIEGKAMPPAALVELSRLPGREQLLGQILGVVQGVTAQFVSTLNEIPRKFVGTLKAVADQAAEKK
jgi:large subunit ribosomal protein L10